MEALVIGGVATVLGAITSHAFHAWLRQRERDRLSSTDRAALTARLDDLDGFRREVKSFMANNRRG